MLGWLIVVGVGVVISGCTWMYLHNGEIREVFAMGAAMICMLTYLYFLEMGMSSWLIAAGIGVVISSCTWMYFHNGKINEAIVVGITTILTLFFFYLLRNLR